MTLTPDQVLAVVSRLGNAGVTGHAEALRRANRNRMGGSSLTSAQMAFLDAAKQVQPLVREKYAHPATAAGVTGGRPRTDGLSPAEVAWLQSLPSDPTKVPFEDAKRLFALTHSVRTPADTPLLQSVAAPIREYHDAKQAEVDLANASTRLPGAPPEALPALADAVAAENPQLEPDEAVTRAANLLRDHGNARLNDQAAKMDEAHRRIDQLKAAAAARVAVHR